MSEQEDQEKEDLARVEKAVESLKEFYDTVHVFVTRHEGGGVGTVNIQIGAGNWFARKGQVIEWLAKEDESTRHSVRKREDTE